MAEDYPRTLMELERRFSTDEACADYLATLRWPDGFRCPRCAAVQAWRTARGLWVCRACGRHTSVTAGTVFGDSNLPLRLWFRAIWQVVTQQDGASAMGLQRVLGLGSYRTAWSLLHKLRRAMVRPGREQLSGTVEVDESYYLRCYLRPRARPDCRVGVDAAGSGRFRGLPPPAPPAAGPSPPVASALRAAGSPHRGNAT